MISRPGLRFSTVVLKGTRPPHISEEGPCSFKMTNGNIAVKLLLCLDFAYKSHTYSLLYTLLFVFLESTTPLLFDQRTWKCILAPSLPCDLTAPGLCSLFQRFQLVAENPQQRTRTTVYIPGIKVIKGLPGAPWCILDRLVNRCGNGLYRIQSHTTEV